MHKSTEQRHQLWPNAQTEEGREWGIMEWEAAEMTANFINIYEASSVWVFAIWNTGGCKTEISKSEVPALEEFTVQQVIIEVLSNRNLG